MTMGASNHLDVAFRKEIDMQGVNIDGHDWSRVKLLLNAEGDHPPPTEDQHTTDYLPRR
jgi:hypothetical protein